MIYDPSFQQKKKGHRSSVNKLNIPHETPKNLPTEHALFDILYLSFFNITSHSHLWGKFMQQENEHIKWVARIFKDQESIIQSFGRHAPHTEGQVKSLAEYEVATTNEDLADLLELIQAAVVYDTSFEVLEKVHEGKARKHD